MKSNRAYICVIRYQNLIPILLNFRQGPSSHTKNKFYNLSGKRSWILSINRDRSSIFTTSPGSWGPSYLVLVLGFFSSPSCSPVPSAGLGKFHDCQQCHQVPITGEEEGMDWPVRRKGRAPSFGAKDRRAPEGKSPR